MGWPAAVNSAAHRRKLLRIHCRGRIGSPMAVGSTSWARAGHRPGSRSSIGLRPPPGRRLRPSGKGSGALSSRSPAETESKSMPVARETRAMPPGPTALSSAPASRRRWRSVRCGDRCAHRPRIAVSWSMPDSTAARRIRFGPYSLTTPKLFNGAVPTPAGDKVYAQAILDAWTAIVGGEAGPASLPKPLVPDNWERATLAPIKPAMLSGTWQELPAEDPNRREQARHFDTIWITNTPGSKLTFR